MMPNDRARPVGDASAIQFDPLDRGAIREMEVRDRIRDPTFGRGREVARAERQERGPDRFVDVPFRLGQARQDAGRLGRQQLALARAEPGAVGTERALDPGPEPGDRRERHEPAQLREVETQRLDDLLDERGAEVDARRGRADSSRSNRTPRCRLVRAPVPGARASSSGASSVAIPTVSAISTNTSGSFGIAGWKNA